MLPGVQKSVKEWTFTHPNELLVWELESQWIPKFLEGDCRGQNSLDWGIPYITRKLLERRCLKWARMTHLDTWNTNYGQKKGWESNWQFDSWPPKVKNRPNSLMWKLCATYCWKALNEGYNFQPHLNRRFLDKVMGPQSHGSPNFGNFETPTWESRDKMSFGSRGQS
jgi:hypothetical protein